MKAHIGLLFKRRGFSLVELIMAITILSIIIAPVVAFIYSSSANNKEAQSLLFASSMNAKAMEALKSKPPEFFASTPSGIFYEDEKYLVKYLVEPVTNFNLPATETTTIPACALAFDLGDSTFSMKNQNAELGSYGLNSTYNLEITGSTSPYQCSLYSVKDVKTLLSTTNVASENGIVSIYIKNLPDRTSSSLPLVLYNLIDNAFPDSDKVNYYVFGNGEGIHLYNAGGKAFNQFLNITDNSSNYTSTLSKIAVITERKGKNPGELGRIISYMGR